MKLYKALLFVGMLAAGSNASAQVKCDESLAVFKKAVLKAEYNEAAGQIDGLLKSCPRTEEAFYTYGSKVFLYKIEVARNEQDKKKAVDAALAFYDAQLKNFPLSDAEIRKALLLESQGGADEKVLFSLLDHAYTVNKANFTEYRALDLYFKLYYNKFTSKEKGFTADLFLNKYVDVLGQINTARETIAAARAVYLKKQENKDIQPEEELYLKDTQYAESALDAVADNISKQVLPLVDCDRLQAFYTPLLDENNDSVAWISGMLKALKAAKCTKSDLYTNGVARLHKLKPTYDSAYDLALVMQKKGKIADAVTYYNEAIKLQSNPVRKAELYMVVAELYRGGDKAKAKEYALKAAEANPKTGMPYLFIAEQYMSLTANDCNLSEFDRKAIVWAAIQMLKKAETAEPRFKTTVASMETEYSKRIPTKKEAKAVKKGKGDVITYGCWINETVTLPKLK